MKTILVFMLMAAFVVADNLVTISGMGGALPFRAPANLLTWQQVKVANNYEGENKTNALYDVSFVVHENSQNVRISYPYGASSQVGAILAGASGVGQFAVEATRPGRYGIAITARYRVNNDNDWSFSTKFFFLWVGQAEDDDDDKKREVSVVAEEVHEFSDRAGDDLELTPDNYFGVGGVQTWNDFKIIAGDNNLNNITFNLVVNDNSVAVGYQTGNYQAFLQKNTTYDTDVSFTGGPGSYNVNVSVRYRKAQNPTFRNYWIVYPLYIDGSGTSSLRLGAAKAMEGTVQENNNVNYVRADVALAVGIAGVALVAVVAVVAAMVVLKKKNDPISV